MAVKITDTTLRDAHQSLMATRLRTADVLPIAGELDRVGFFSLEPGGVRLLMPLSAFSMKTVGTITHPQGPHPPNSPADAPSRPKSGWLPALC